MLLAREAAPTTRAWRRKNQKRAQGSAAPNTDSPTPTCCTRGPVDRCKQSLPARPHVWPRSCLPTNLLEANINRTTTTQITPGRPCEILSVSPPVAHSTAAHVTVVRRKQYSTASEPMLQSAGSAVWQVVACIGNPTTCMQLWKKKMQVRYYRLLEEVRVEEQRTPKVHNMANVYGH
jgi:hypothetical protein